MPDTMTAPPPAAADGPPSAPASGRLLSARDLDDTARFLAFRNVPVLDEHKHKVKGDIDPGLLELIAANSNRRAEAGNFSLVLKGHTTDDGPEEAQPEPVGYAKNFRVGDYHGRACLLADMHFYRDKVRDALSFPHRSVERFRSEKNPDANYIEAISLLRRTPERDLGLLTYARTAPADAVLVRYNRDLPPLGMAQADPDPRDHPREPTMDDTQDLGMSGGMGKSELAGMIRSIVEDVLPAIIIPAVVERVAKSMKDLLDGKASEAEGQPPPAAPPAPPQAPPPGAPTAPPPPAQPGGPPQPPPGGPPHAPPSPPGQGTPNEGPPPHGRDDGQDDDAPPPFLRREQLRREQHGLGRERYNFGCAGPATSPPRPIGDVDDEDEDADDEDFDFSSDEEEGDTVRNCQGGRPGTGNCEGSDPMSEREKYGNNPGDDATLEREGQPSGGEPSLDSVLARYSKTDPDLVRYLKGQKARFDKQEVTIGNLLISNKSLEKRLDETVSEANARVRYSARRGEIADLHRDGFDLDADEEFERLKDLPEEVYNKEVGRIRTRYRRTVVDQGFIPLTPARPAPGGGPAKPSEDEVAAIVRYADDKDIDDYETAKERYHKDKAAGLVR